MRNHNSDSRSQHDCVQVTAPSRLHFGLMSYGGPGRQFGGAGVMIDQPSTQLTVRAARTFSASGPGTQRAIHFAKTWSKNHSIDLDCHLEIVQLPPEHVGLGTGTQLGLSVAAALNALYGIVPARPRELAASVGRGKRSAVGTHGFFLGGLIVERGKQAEELLSPLDCQLSLPEDWRVVLVRPTHCRGLSGIAEQQAFSELPVISPAVTETLTDELRQNLLPAAAQGAFTAFSQSLFRYGQLAGSCFATQQGGSYNGPRLTQLVHQILEMGVEGVGQSSWGPTLFALLPTLAEAQAFCDKLRRLPDLDGIDLLISHINRGGHLLSASDSVSATGQAPANL
ncbi:MAG: beta-RFAP synthase [Planctomycetaceae bacterium]|nr:beta-RFAP synthase [Planctomycetaceae bacterium]